MLPRLSLPATLAVVSVLAVLPVHAAEQSGIVVAAMPAAHASAASGDRELESQSKVFMGDRVVTGRYGRAQIELLDKTRLVVGPASSLVIDEFVYAGNQKANEVAVNAVRGAFRFITGQSNKPAYLIRTPSATIGIRGTEFDLTVDGDGTTNVALLSGAMRICGAGACIELTGRCALAKIPRRRPPQAVDMAAYSLDDFVRTYPYINSQANLWRAFRVDGAGSCARQRASLPPGAGQPDIGIRTGSIPPPDRTPPGPTDPGTGPSDPGTGPSDPGTGGSGNGNKGPGNGAEADDPGNTESNNPGGISSPPGHTNMASAPGNSENAPGRNR